MAPGATCALFFSRLQIDRYARRSVAARWGVFQGSWWTIACVSAFFVAMQCTKPTRPE